MHLLYIAIGFGVLGVLTLLHNLLTQTSGKVVPLTIVKCKNKYSKSRKYCYPKVVGENGKEFYVHSLRANGHDQYFEGNTVDFYVSPITKKYKSVKGLYHQSIGFFIAMGLLLFVFFNQ